MTGCLNIAASRVGTAMDIAASRVGTAMDIRVGIVCTLEHLAYLDIDKESVWLTELNGFEDNILITSNTNWNIL